MAPYTITIKSDYAELWRYNISVICEVRAKGKRVDLLKHNDEIASVSDEPRTKPEGYNECRDVVLSSLPGEELLLYVYILPHTAPSARNVGELQPFNVHIKIEHGADIVHNRYHSINCWSGDNIEIKL